MEREQGAPPGATEAVSWRQPVVLWLIAALAAVSFILLVVPDLRFVAVAPALDLVINASTTLVAIGVAGLAWARWRETAVPAHFYEAAAFIVLSASGLIFVGVVIAGLDRAIGLSLAEPQQTPLYLRAAGRLIGGLLLLLATLSAVRGVAGRPRGQLTLVLLGIYAAVVAMILAVGQGLPELINEEGLARLRVDPEVPSQLPGITPIGAIVHLFGASLFFSAALLLSRGVTGTPPHRPPYFEAGFVLAAFGELHAAAYPGTYTSLVTTADILRLGFYGVLLLGITADTRADIRALRVANDELSVLRQSDLARVALEERAHLAREIHDGISQELWLARLKAGQLADEAPLEAEARGTLAELTAAIDAGLADASHAVIALRTRTDGEGFVAFLEEYAAEFMRRFGITVRLEAADALPPISPRTEAEAIRIVQEALNNARKHADATLVRIVVEEEAGRLSVAVVDNGRGFDPGTATRGFGLQSMSERSTRIGAALDIRSAPSEGTTVRVIIPPGERSNP